MTLPAALPPVIPVPFAQNAPGGNINNPIPDTTATSGLASYDQGFPTITMQPVVGGGIPPEGQDFNGILFAITAHLYYLQSGQRWQFNAAVAAAIGGYPVGAIVAMADDAGEWINQAANNSTNPDTAGYTSNGSGWVPLNCYGFVNINVGAGVGLIQVTNAQARRPILIINGALSANVIIELPAWAQEWLVINNTTNVGGTFFVTFTAGGSGVTVPQGGPGSPTGIYGLGDGAMYPSVSPLGVPISISPTPGSLVERDANGYVYATYFNTSQGQDNTTVVDVITDQGDGFFRRNSLANFQSQLALQNFAGAVTAAQVPQAAVTQYTPQILASAVLTGSPTAPTQALGSSTSLVANTQFVNPGTLANNQGYRRMPDGTIEQWGFATTTANAGNVTIPFTIVFPNNVFNVVTTTIATSGVGGAGSREEYINAIPTQSGFVIREIASANPAIIVYWRAVGN